MEEAIGPFLCISVFVVLIIVLVSNALAQGKRRDRVWQQLATRHGGSCTPGGLFGYPSVQFTYTDTSVLVDTYSTGGRNPARYTQIHFYWPDTQFRLEVYPEGVFARIRKFFGMEDMQIGSADFDRQYIIHGSDPNEVRTFLSPHVMHAINQLRVSGAGRDIYVSLTGGHFLVKKHRLDDKYDELQRVVDLGLQLYEQALLTRTTGIEFVKEEAAMSLDAAVCRICGEPVTHDAAICRRCKTPHHRECWQYYGACSTYGCGETRYVVVKKKSTRDTEHA